MNVINREKRERETNVLAMSLLKSEMKKRLQLLPNKLNSSIFTLDISDRQLSKIVA